MCFGEAVEYTLPKIKLPCQALPRLITKIPFPVGVFWPDCRTESIPFEPDAAYTAVGKSGNSSIALFSPTASFYRPGHSPAANITISHLERKSFGPISDPGPRFKSPTYWSIRAG